MRRAGRRHRRRRPVRGGDGAPARREGVADSVEAARTYLRHEAGNHFDAERVDAFLRHGPAMVEFFERETAVRFVLGPTFADYHPDAPGGTLGGRSICAAPFDARELGAEKDRLRPPLREITFLGMMIGTGKELVHFFNATRSARSAALVAGLLARHGRGAAWCWPPAASRRTRRGGAPCSATRPRARSTGRPRRPATPATG